MSATVTVTTASLIDAHSRRFALAGEVGRMRGAIRLALASLDFAVANPSLAVGGSKGSREGSEDGARGGERAMKYIMTLNVILTWVCQRCGWGNDNNNGPCRKCGAKDG